MNFLNPSIFILILFALLIFKPLLKKSKEHSVYTRQSKLMLLSLLFALLALSRPVLINEISHEKFDANEYILAIDVSYSMQMKDVQPSRYLRAKETIIKLLKNNAQDRFTIFAFSKNPLLISPPTTDHNIAISALEALSPQYILTKSTSLRALIAQVAKLDQEHKELILFSDGGDDYALSPLIEMAHQHAITINIVAVSSRDGTIITENNHALKDENNHLVFSKANPILKQLAKESGGFYLALEESHTDLSTKIANLLKEHSQRAKELSTDVVSYSELYYLPLLLSFFILIFSLSRYQRYLPLFTLLFIIIPPHSAHASLLDFYYHDIAQNAYESADYLKAQKYFKKLSASQYSYMSLANAYYKNRQYKYALRVYTQIKSANPHTKSILLYNMGNSAFKLKEYQRASSFYQQSIRLEFSQEAYDNLMVIYRLQLKSKLNVSDMLPHVNDKKVKNITKKNDTKKDEESKSSNNTSRQNAAQGSQGGAGSKTKKKNQDIKIHKGSKNDFKMGYNAYELINKGYVNEKKPW